MTTRYEKFLSTVPCFGGLHRRELRIVAGLVDVVVVPAGGQLSPAKGEVIVAVLGQKVTNPDGSMLAVTPLRLLVFGRRELLSLFEALPDLALRPLRDNDTTASRIRPRGFRRLRTNAERTRSFPTVRCAPMGSLLEPLAGKVGRRGP